MASQAAQPAASLDAQQAAQAQSRDQSSASQSSADSGKSASPSPVPADHDSQLALAGFDLDRFSDIPYRIDILIGSTVKTIKDILEIETGDTVVLDRQAHEPVILTIEGRIVAQAEVVSSDKGASIQITEVGWEE